MAKSKYIEALEEQYTKKDAKSVLRYKAPDNKWRYVQTSKDASGGNMPSSGGITEVTWQELKDKRDNGELNPGSLYRITDYKCTTTQENTRSAGHQFDIVLLALSENKLAEEGWAMMHDNIYDVTFDDGVTKKCYIYHTGDNIDEDVVQTFYNIVDIETLLGIEDDNDVTIDENNKTAETSSASSDLTDSNLTYNYFQNSNLSAWKVWYCLDNDTTRFTWADNSIDESGPASFYCAPMKGSRISKDTYIRNTEIDIEIDGQIFYGWTGEETSINCFTLTEEVQEEDELYLYNNGTEEMESDENKPLNFTPAHEGTNLPNGRGVIYRLIDEWNNDVPYDFKNIQIYNRVFGLYVYAVTDTDATEEDPTLDGVRVKAIHLLSNWHNELYPICAGKLSTTALENVIFINNSNIAGDISNTIARNGSSIIS